MKIKGENAHVGLAWQLRRIMMLSMVSVLVIISVLLVTIQLNNERYQDLMHNLSVASGLGLDFKTNVDLQVYWMVVGSSYYDEEATNQMVEEARSIVCDLESTTTDKANQKRIRSMMSILNNLTRYIENIKETKGYDKRTEKLEMDIYTVTELFTDFMNEYIHSEAVAMANQQEVISRKNMYLMITLLPTAALVVSLMFLGGIRLTQRTTKPLAQLCENARRLAVGDFTIQHVYSDSEEVSVLVEAFEIMTSKIERLVKKGHEEQELLRQQEFRLLQAQINPHFLYNTLDTIVWLEEAGQHAQVKHIVGALSVFFRTMLNGGRDVITLESEFAHVRSYLEIQKVRYQDILDYEIDEAPELLQSYVPKLTLQPLVENALYHGIKTKRGRGTIRISSRLEEDNAVLRVEDDGIGIMPERLSALRCALRDGRTESFGLYSVQQRLQIYCSIQNCLYIESKPGVGTCVTIRIPNITHTEESKNYSLNQNKTNIFP